MKESINRQDIEARIRYRSHRGMLELDLLLQPFIDKTLPTLCDADVLALDLFLDNIDPDLYQWLMGYSEPPAGVSQKFVQLIRNVPE